MRNLIHLSLIPVLLAAGGWSVLSAQTITASPTSLTLSGQFQGAVVSQQLSVTSASGAVSFTIFGNANNPQWLKVSIAGSAPAVASSGTTPATVTVLADPTGLNPNTYTSSLSIVPAGSSTAVMVPVTFTVSTIGASPSSLTFGPYTQGGSTVPPAQAVSLTGSGGYTAVPTTQSGGQWLSVNPTSGSVPGGFFASLNAAIVTGLAVGVYQGSIQITPVNTSNNTPIAIPVTLTITPTPPVTVNPSFVTFNVQPGGSGNITSQTLTISTTPGQSLNYSLQASYASGTPSFLTISPASGNTDPTSGNAQVTIGYNLTGLTVGNTYKGTITLFTAGGTPQSQSIQVALNYSATPLLNVPSSTLNYVYQLGGGAPADQTVAITSTDGSLITFAISQSANSSWLTVPNSGSTAAPFTVHVNPAGLTPGTYSATVNITPASSSTPQQIPVVLKVSNDPFISSNTSSMSFPFQIGQAAPAAQNLLITSSNGAPLNYTVTPSTTTCGGWLLLNGAANAITSTTSLAGPISVSIATSGLAAGTCKGSISISATVASTGVAAVNSPLSIPVTLVVDTKPMLVTTPAALSFAAPAGGQSPSPQTIALSSTSGTDVLSCTVNFSGTSGGVPWLFAGPTTCGTSSNNMITVTVQSSALPAGTYNGTVVIAATNSGGAATANSPVTIPVTLQVTSGSLTLSATSLNFAYTIGGASPATQTVNVGSSTSNSLVFSAVAASTPTAWLSVTPTSGNTGSSGTITVSVDGTKLTTPGTYNGTITVTSPGAGNSPATVNVTVVVSAGTISAPTTTLSFIQVTGGSAPPAQTIAVTGSPAPLGFTVAASTTPAGGTWLSATPASGTTPGTISVSVNAGSLPVAQYSGTVTITSTGASGSPIMVPVVLNVVNPSTATASPTSLSFNFIVGQQAPAAQTLNIASPTQIPIAAAIQYTGSNSMAGNWLQVTPASTNAPANLSVAVQPGTLAPGTYNANINITSPNLAAPLTVPVTFTVTAIPMPVITAVGNAASYSTGPVSPGENVTIFGTGIGPATLVSNTVTNGAFGTSLGNTRVLFDGVAAPIIYASATQTSVMVPYGVNGRTSTSIVVEFTGVQSNPITFSVAGSAPGIYTLNAQGTGPGAILNQDFSVNGPNNPEKRGNVIQVYMTGEGQTSPAGVDGAIIGTTLKNPVLPVTAMIGGVPVTGSAVAYAGSAPGLVSGIMQVNLVIPQSVTPGSAVPIVITVGANNSQNGVTVAIQ